MPRRACAGLEGDEGSGYAGRIGWAEQRIDPSCSLKYSAGPFPDGCEPALLISMFESPPLVAWIVSSVDWSVVNGGQRCLWKAAEMVEEIAYIEIRVAFRRFSSL